MKKENVIFGMSCLKQQNEQKDFSDQIAQLSPILEEELPGPDDLAQRRTDAEEKLAARQAFLPTGISSAEILESVIRLADKSHIKDLSLCIDPLSSDNVGENEYRVLVINIKAKGNFPDLLDFIGMLEDGTIRALAINRISVIQADGMWNASLDIAVYAQSLPPDITTPDSE